MKQRQKSANGDPMVADSFSLPENTTHKALYFLLIAVLLAFGIGLRGSFHFDDYSLFSDPAVTYPSGWWAVWLPLRTRPLTYLTFWLNYQLGGLNAAGYHAVNIVLHLCAVWLLYGLLCRLIGQKAAFIATVIFALHPIQSEAVLYVFERATLLATVLCFLCWRSWLDRRYWIAIVWFAFALLSKEECVTFPLFLLMFHRAFWPIATMLGLSLAAGIRVIIFHAALHVQTVGVATASTGAAAAPYSASLSAVIFGYFRLSLLPYLCTQGRVVLRYFRLLLLPYGFTVDPDVRAVLDWQGWLAWAAILITATLFWRLYRHGKWFAAGLVLLLPSSSIFPAADLAADRRMYLAVVALAAMAGLALRNIKGLKIVIPLAFLLSALSFARSRVWLTEHSLWSEAVERAPNKVRPLLQLSRASDAETALLLLDRAQSLAPGDSRPAEEKGLRLLAINRPDQALVEFEYALRLLPNDPELLNNRGVALSFLGSQSAAADQFRHALAINPCLAIARRNLERLGIAYPVSCQGGRAALQQPAAVTLPNRLNDP